MDIKFFDGNLTEEDFALLEEMQALSDNLNKFYSKLVNHDASDKRWVAEGRTDAQKALMCWGRSICGIGDFF